MTQQPFEFHPADLAERVEQLKQSKGVESWAARIDVARALYGEAIARLDAGEQVGRLWELASLRGGAGQSGAGQRWAAPAGLGWGGSDGGRQKAASLLVRTLSKQDPAPATDTVQNSWARYRGAKGGGAWHRTVLACLA
jgi:hypothetical protein